jgi:uncharacterized damage-inducible protein DinB
VSETESAWTTGALLDLHGRVHRMLAGLLEQCGELSPEELDREMSGFGYPSIRLQLHHVLAAERYWVGVLRGELLVDEDDANFPSAQDLERLRRTVAEGTRNWLAAQNPQALSTAVDCLVWGGAVRSLVPAAVLLRPMTHAHHHAGQVLAMIRLLGREPRGADLPIA